MATGALRPILAQWRLLHNIENSLYFYDPAKIAINVAARTGILPLYLNNLFAISGAASTVLLPHRSCLVVAKKFERDPSSNATHLHHPKRSDVGSRPYEIDGEKS